MGTLFTTTCDSLAEWDQVAANIFVGPGGQSGNGIGSNVAGYSLPWLCKRLTITGDATSITVKYAQWIPPGVLPFPTASAYFVGGGGFPLAKRQPSLNCNGAGVLHWRRGNYNGPVIATCTGGWIAGVWNEIEYTVTISNSDGAIKLSNNGVVLLDVHGLDTQQLATDVIDGVEIVPQSVAGPTALIDNVLVTGGVPDVLPTACSGGTVPAAADPP